MDRWQRPAVGRAREAGSRGGDSISVARWASTPSNLTFPLHSLPHTHSLANALDVDGGARADDDGAYDEEYTKGGKGVSVFGGGWIFSRGGGKKAGSRKLTHPFPSLLQYASPLDTYQSQGRTTIKTQKAKPVEEDDEDDVEEVS